MNKLAYFNYQQSKIYIRTNEQKRKVLKKNKAQKKPFTKKFNQIIILDEDKCKHCASNSIALYKKSSIDVVDLKFMKNGLKKWVIKYINCTYYCNFCKKKFASANIRNRFAFGDNLVKRCVNQHIQHLTSYNSIVEMLNEFNIYPSLDSRILECKSRLAKQYTKTYNMLKNSLFKGLLVHADETQLKIRKLASCYVWVFASMDTVIYVFRQNREVDFLGELFKDFSGVLVTDFYPGYDSLSCKHQKCIVHLMRDINSDFYKNQLDKELEEIVVAFGKLLRKNLAAIDKYGLKHRNLRRFIKDVDRFYNKVLNKNFESELAIKFKKRFIKYKNSLFTFLQIDNIPWNNNNAEYAVKSFATIRAKANNLFTEKSINDYMILLSIQQTCKYRNLKFLDFLKSKELDLDKYSCKTK